MGTRLANRFAAYPHACPGMQKAMARRSDTAIPDVALAEHAPVAALLGFGLLALALFGALAYAGYRHRKRAADGIYTKYRLPDDAPKTARTGTARRCRDD